MAIKSKFIIFDTLANFLSTNGIGGTAPSTDYIGNVPKGAVVFIKNTGLIWFNGNYFGIDTSLTYATQSWVTSQGYTKNTGTVTSIATGAGLTGGTITTSGTIKANLVHETKASFATSETPSNRVTGRSYPVSLDSNGKLMVYVPWADNNTTSFTITANATDGLWDITGTNGTNAVTYAVGAYSSQQSKASFDTSSTAPTRSDRLNYNGYLYATKLFSGGVEVLTSHQSLSNYYTKTESDNKYVYKSGDTITGNLTVNGSTTLKKYIIINPYDSSYGSNPIQLYWNDVKHTIVGNTKLDGTNNTAVDFLHSGNSSVSKSGETLTVKINGTSLSLTNTNTWNKVSISQDGYVIKPSTTQTTALTNSDVPYVLAWRSGVSGATEPAWFQLPATAFSSNSTTVNGFNVTDRGFLYKYTHSITYSTTNLDWWIAILFSSTYVYWHELLIQTSYNNEICRMILEHTGMSYSVRIRNNNQNGGCVRGFAVSGYGKGGNATIYLHMKAIQDSSSGHYSPSTSATVAVYSRLVDFSLSTLSSQPSPNVNNGVWTSWAESEITIYTMNQLFEGHLIPNRTKALDLGNSQHIWNYLYANNLSDGTNSLTVANIKSTYDWYQTMTTGNTDGTINKWKEIESFVNGISDTSTLNGILLNYFCYRGVYSSTNIASSTPTKADLADTSKLNGLYRVTYPGASGALINFNGAGSTSYVLFYTTYDSGMLWRQSTDANYNAWRTILDSSNYTSYINLSLSGYLPLSGGTLTGYLGYNSLYLPIIKGGVYTTNQDVHTGCITINLPADIGNTMTSMWIDVYNYSTGTSFSVHIGGYAYKSDNTWQHNPAVMVYGANHRVRLGYNNGFKIYIGETNSTWHYPQVLVRDVICGFGCIFSKIINNWSISFETTLPTIPDNANRVEYAWTTRNFNPSNYITSITTNGDYLRWVKNGGNNDITVPYAIKASYLLPYAVNTVNEAVYSQRLRWFSQISRNSNYYAGSDSTNIGFPASNNANGILWLGTHPDANSDPSKPYGGQIGISSDGRIYYRYCTATISTAENGGSWRTIAWKSDIPTKTSQLTNDSGFLTSHQSLANYLPLSGGTMKSNAYIGFDNDATAFRMQIGADTSTSPLRGITTPTVGGRWIGIFARPGKSTDEGGFLLSQEGAVIYNSFDSGFGFKVVDTDANLNDWNSANSVVFSVRNDNTVYSKGGFVKQNSSDSYVLLGGGGHKAVSDFATSSHNHTFKLGSTTITTNGSQYTTINGPLAIVTSASPDNAFSIQRENASEGVKHWVDDGTYHIEYTNDETANQIAFRFINTDTERSENKGADASDNTVYLNHEKNFYPSVDNTGSIGTSLNRWKNMYATTFYGSLSGRATMATRANNADKADIATKATSANTATRANSADKATRATNADNAACLSENETLQFGKNSLLYFNGEMSSIGTASTNGGPTNNYYHIIRMNHGNPNGYFTDIACGINTHDMWYRRIVNGGVSSQGWTRILDSNNTYINNGTITINGSSITPVTSLSGYATTASLNNYVLKTGDTMSGKLTINVARSSTIFPLDLLTSGMQANDLNVFRIGQSASTGNNGLFIFKYVGDNNNNNTIHFGFYNNYLILNILNSGNVGIGTTSPSYLLDVNGTTRSSYVLSTLMCARHLDAGKNAVNADHNLYIGYGALTYTNHTYLYYSTGSSGSDSTTSRTLQATVDVNGFNVTSHLSIGSDLSSYDTTRAELDVISATDTPCDIWLGVNKTRYWYLSARHSSQTNSLYIGRTNGSGTVEISVPVSAVDFTATSDIRLKRDIQQISDHIYSFRFKDSDKLHYGFIALELEKEHPDLVGEGEYKTVNYNSALSLYVAELENRVKILENEINNLKNK